KCSSITSAGAAIGQWNGQRSIGNVTGRLSEVNCNREEKAMPQIVFREGSKSPQARIARRLDDLSQGDVKVETQPTRTVTCIYNAGSQSDHGGHGANAEADDNEENGYGY